MKRDVVVEVEIPAGMDEAQALLTAVLSIPQAQRKGAKGFNLERIMDDDGRQTAVVRISK